MGSAVSGDGTTQTLLGHAAHHGGTDIVQYLLSQPNIDLSKGGVRIDLFLRVGQMDHSYMTDGRYVRTPYQIGIVHHNTLGCLFSE